jgi:hypothetical protein
MTEPGEVSQLHRVQSPAEPTTVPTQSDQAPAQPQSDQKWSWKTALAIWAVLGPLASGLGTFWLTHRQTAVSEKTLDLATGKTEAQLSVRLYPDQKDVPKAYRLKNRFLEDAVYFHDIDALLSLNPSVIVRNIGQEPVGTLKIETHFHFGFIDTTDLPPDEQRNKTPWVLRQVEKEEYPLSEKLMPGQEVRVSIVRGLTGQMVQAQAVDQRKVSDHFGVFEINCYGKIVGGVIFDPAKEPIAMAFAWKPTGFPEDRCQKVVETMQPQTEFLRFRK